MREAIEQSLNVPIARLGLAVGPDQVVATARALGIESPLLPVPSVALGAFEVTLLEAARAYAVFAVGRAAPGAALLHASGSVSTGACSSSARPTPRT